MASGAPAVTLETTLETPVVTETLTQPSPTPTVMRSPPAGPLETIGAVLAIVFALAAGIIGYRIIRGGRGL